MKPGGKPPPWEEKRSLRMKNLAASTGRSLFPKNSLGEVAEGKELSKLAGLRLS